MSEWHLIDLHVHSALSPCADDEMVPRQVIQRCREIGLTLIAICDHNSCQNVGAFMKAAYGTGITVIAGMELTTSEEVHVLCLFPDLVSACRWDNEVSRSLPPVENSPKLFGHQLLLGSEGEVIGEVRTLLLSASSLSLATTCQMVEGDLKGLVIPAHIDRTSFSLIGQLGFPPPDIAFSAMELSQNSSRESFVARNPFLRATTMIHGSDAHRLRDLWAPKQTVVRVERPSFSELVAALRREGERRVVTDLLTCDESLVPRP
ncbi:MAG: PHP domain-containing protein [Bacillota bacterium]